MSSPTFSGPRTAGNAAGTTVDLIRWPCPDRRRSHLWIIECRIVNGSPAYSPVFGPYDHSSRPHALNRLRELIAEGKTHAPTQDSDIHSGDLP